jgi:hypothetical protein
MLGPAELRFIEEALREERPESGLRGLRSPYLSPNFAAGMAVTRAMTGNLKRLDPRADAR